VTDVAIRAAAESRLERLYRATPLLSAFIWLCIVYAWEARGHVTPWLYSDELQMAQLSRSIWETGEPMRRGEAFGWPSVTAYLIAPFWAINDTGTAYAAIKYFSVALMSSAMFPTYFLARMLVGRTAALFAGTATAAIPALAYSAFLLEEPLAYPWAALCLFLIVKSLATRSRWWIAAAVAACLLAGLVRDQLAVMPVVYAAAAIFVFWTSERARRWRSQWSRWDWVGFVVLSAGVVIVASAIIGSQSDTWLIASGSYRGRMIEYGLWAAGALVIGTGVLPAVAALAALARPRSEPRTPVMRAFVATTLSALVFFGLYAAAKASYLSTVFATRTEERNLIYVAPLLFVGTALWLERPRLRLVAIGAAAGFVAYLVTTSPYRMDVHLDGDAFGLAILQWANRNLSFTPTDAKWALVGILVFAAALIVARMRYEGSRIALGLAALAAVLVVAWNISGQIAAGTASNSFSRDLLDNFPTPPDWIDKTGGGTPTVLLGQKIDDPTGVWTMEFWNRSLTRIWSLDSTAPGPGPIITPDLVGTHGELYPDPTDADYVVAGEGVNVFGPLVDQPTIRTVTTEDEFGFQLPEPIVQERAYPYRIVRLLHPLRLRSGQTGIYSDGWTGEQSAYTQFSTPGGRAGWAKIIVSRAGWRGPDKPGHVTVRIGTLVAGPDKQPAMGRLAVVERWTIHSGTERTFVLRTPKPPIRMDVRITPTFVPRDYGLSSDPRELGAQVSYAFSLTKPR
jgi:hypothetical protein